MSSKLYWFWAVSELSTAVLLFKGMSGWAEISAFLLSHALTMWLTYIIVTALIGSRRPLKRNLLSRAFLYFMLLLTAVPLVGPAVILFLAVFLVFFHLQHVHSTDFMILVFVMSLELSSKY